MQKILLLLIVTLVTVFTLPVLADAQSSRNQYVQKKNADKVLLAKLSKVNAYKAKVKAKTKKRNYSKKKRTKRLSRSAKRKAYQRHVSKVINQDYYNVRGPLKLFSEKAIVINQLTGETVYEKNKSTVTPIASLTKLMTAMVALDAQLAMSDYLFITKEDVDNLKGTRSRLKVGTMLTRGELLQLALMSSENRAAAALSRHYTGGRAAFINAMNTKAAFLGMKNTHFVDATGLNSHNVSTADDLVKLVNAAHQYDEIRYITTTASQAVVVNGRSRPLKYVNTNALVRGSKWDIGLSKTGFINEAGRCLVMQAEIAGEPMIIVLLDSNGKYTRLGDANRIRKWYEYNQQRKQAKVAAVHDTHS